MLNRRPVLSLLLALTFTAACSEPRARDSGATGDESCVDCHGSAENGNAAPPPVRWEDDAAPDAHQIHLSASTSGTPHPAYACSTCHVVPERVLDEGHLDGDDEAEVVFGELADEEGAQPAFDREAASCANTYCHGATLSGGYRTEVVWTAVGQNQAQCGTCHTLPPPEDHPDVTSTQCSLCHGSVVDSSLTFIAPELHVNGTVELSGGACDSCHGASGNAAPPPALGGETATTDIGVGAHAQHLATSDWHAPVACDECHIVPVDPDQPGHWDTPQPAEVVFGEVATASATNATWSRDTATCAVYCHGTNVGAEDGAFLTPVWTEVGAGQAACGGCHALPPGGDHPPREDCQLCHGAVIAGGAAGEATVWVDATLHVNGTADVPQTCNGCHGDAGAADATEPSTWAPPTDLAGLTTGADVGAHQAHLATSEWRDEVLCVDCHQVPATLLAPGHMDDADDEAELTWSRLSIRDGATPTWSPGTNECTNYCHGSTLSGGTNTTPSWVGGAAEAECGSCHGLPPTQGHPNDTDCSKCHGAVVAPDDVTIVRPDLHVNGAVDL